MALSTDRAAKIAARRKALEETRQKKLKERLSRKAQRVQAKNSLKNVTKLPKIALQKKRITSNTGSSSEKLKRSNISRRITGYSPRIKKTTTKNTTTKDNRNNRISLQKQRAKKLERERIERIRQKQLSRKQTKVGGRKQTPVKPSTTRINGQSHRIVSTPNHRKEIQGKNIKSSTASEIELMKLKNENAMLKTTVRKYSHKLDQLTAQIEKLQTAGSGINGSTSNQTNKVSDHSSSSTDMLLLAKELQDLESSITNEDELQPRTQSSIAKKEESPFSGKIQGSSFALYILF